MINVLKCLPLLLLTLAFKADANLGETKEQSVAHYGRIIYTKPVTGICVCNVKGFWITEWFNNNGKCEEIAYFKKSGNISQAESHAFSKVNLPAFASDQDWMEQQIVPQVDDNVHLRVWLTPDGVWRFESSYTKMGKFYYSSLVLGTDRAARLLAKLVQSGEEPPPQKAPSTVEGLTEELPL
jgi:hypothetical protein